jgi:hypothetical protein
MASIKFKKVTAYNKEGKNLDDNFFINCNEIVNIGGEKKIEGKDFCFVMFTAGAGCWVQMTAEASMAFFNAE